MPPIVENQGEIADLGILFVHGIGKQSQGETLLSAAGPLVEWLKKQNGNSLEILSVYLKPGREPGRPPAHAVVEGSINSNKVRLLLAESWWAEEFYAPPPLKFASWLLQFGAWVLLQHVAEQVSNRAARLFRRLSWPVSQGVLLAAMVTGPLLFAFVIAPFQFSVLLLAVLSLIPFFKIGEHAAKGLRFLADVIGDSYVYASDPMSRQAVHTRIREDIAWLSARAHQVSVVAHSQGAAAVVDTLQSHPAQCGLITYGAGIRKLRDLEYQKEQPSFGFRLAQLSWIYSIGSIWAISVIHQDIQAALAGATVSLPERGAALLYLFGGIFLAYMITAANREHTEKIDQKLQEIASRIAVNGIPWTDLTATADPVPGGLLFRMKLFHTDPQGWIDWPQATWPGTPMLCSAWVRNTLNPLSDHTSYWESHDDFVPRVMVTLDAQSSLSLSPPAVGASLLSSSRWRAMRGAFRWCLHASLFAMSLVVYFKLGANCRAWLQQLLGNWFNKVDASSRTTLGLVNFSLFVLGLALHILAVWVWVHFLSASFWGAWDKGARAPTRKQRLLANLALIGFLISVAVGVDLLRAALQQGSYSAIPHEALRFGLLIHKAVLWLLRAKVSS